ncbi:unnamed protein product [Polarella glacialis]|uniref:PX domain-containing protein n=1 Tax=Polarella glacialis TaxID=89957 RepID=A0A813IQV6_POLGL|nr:unnamed protein product [Polarella glacialis]
MTVSAEGGAGEAPKGTVIVLTDSFLSIKIIGFECSEGIFNRHVAYSIVVSCLGLSATVSKTYTQFQGLRQELERTAFRANFDTVFLEKRRQQLETYLRMLATHSLVGTARGHSVAVAHREVWAFSADRPTCSSELAGFISEKYESIFALDARYFSGSANAGSDSVTEPEMDFCLHAAVRDALCREIQEPFAQSLDQLAKNKKCKYDWS